MNELIRTAVLIACTAAVTAGPVIGETGSGDSGPFGLNTVAVSGTDDGGDLPRVSRLGPCRPNPFNPGTTISYELAAPGAVHLAVYDLRGRLVRTIVDGQPLPPGRHEAHWDGRDGHGASAAGGVYLYRIRTGDYVAARSMTLVK